MLRSPFARPFLIQAIQLEGYCEFMDIDTDDARTGLTNKPILRIGGP